MTQTFKFTQAINVDGKVYCENDTIGEADILPGCFASLRRMKKLVPCDDIPPDLIALQSEEPDEQPAETVPTVAETPKTPYEKHHKKRHK